MKKIRKQLMEYSAMPFGYYHLCTDGWQEGKLFHTREQFSKGMNTMALVKVIFGVKIYAFELMKNHIHTILAATGEQCVKIFQYIKKRTNAHLVADGYPPLPKDYMFKLIPITGRDSMKRHIIYLARNPYEKGFCSPGGYLWGTGYLAFNQFVGLLGGTPVRDISARTVSRIIKSKTQLPQRWIIHQELGILPSNYIETEAVMGLFQSVKEYCTMMVKDYESFSRISSSLEEDMQWSVEEVRDMAFQIISKDFPGKVLWELTPEEKCRLAVKLNNAFGVVPKTLSSALNIREHIIVQSLRSKDYGVRPFQK